MTMLYVGGGKDEEIAARNPRLAGPQDVAKLREEFQQRQGEVLGNWKLQLHIFWSWNFESVFMCFLTTLDYSVSMYFG